MKRTMFLTTLFGASPSQGRGRWTWVEIGGQNYAIWIDRAGKGIVSIKLKKRGMTKEKAQELLSLMKRNFNTLVEGHKDPDVRWDVYEALYDNGTHHCFSPRLVCPESWILG